MFRSFFEEGFRVGRTTTVARSLAVMLPFAIGLVFMACGTSDHTHAGDDIDSGTVGEARLDTSIARDNEVPFVQAQRDNNPDRSTNVTDPNAVQTANRVSIRAPSDGFLLVLASISLINRSDTSKYFTVYTFAGTEGVAFADVTLPPPAGFFSNEHVALTGTVPVSAGEHTVTLEVDLRYDSAPRAQGWGYNDNNLSVIFFPSSRSGVQSPPSV